MEAAVQDVEWVGKGQERKVVSIKPFLPSIILRMKNICALRAISHPSFRCRQAENEATHLGSFYYVAHSLLPSECHIMLSAWSRTVLRFIRL